MIRIPQELLPRDGRFGSGPAKVRPSALEHLVANAHILGTSHRQAPVRDLVADVQQRLGELYAVPAGYEVVLGNGGSTLFWDMATFSLIERRSAHGVFGEFSRKFAAASAAAPHLQDPAVNEAPASSVALPEATDADTYCWAQNETSTGAAAPVRRIGDGLVLIDATSAAGGMTAEIAETDVYYFAPQKNFSSDGGLWLTFASPAAIERAERIKTDGRWIPAILDFSAAVKNSRQHQSLNTPAIATLLLMQDQLGWLADLGGIEAAEQRCRASSEILYDWAERSEVASPFVAEPAHRSPVVATIDLDESVDAARVIGLLRRHGVVDIDPYRALKRNQIRVGCYTSVDPEDVTALTRCLDYVIDELASTGPVG